MEKNYFFREKINNWASDAVNIHLWSTLGEHIIWKTYIGMDEKIVNHNLMGPDDALHQRGGKMIDDVKSNTVTHIIIDGKKCKQKPHGKRQTQFCNAAVETSRT